MVAALAECGSGALQMIDSPIIRAHHCAAGGTQNQALWPFARRLLDRNSPSKPVTVATSGDYGRTRPALVMKAMPMPGVITVVPRTSAQDCAFGARY